MLGMQSAMSSCIWTSVHGMTGQPRAARAYLTLNTATNTPGVVELPAVRVLHCEVVGEDLLQTRLTPSDTDWRRAL